MIQKEFILKYKEEFSHQLKGGKVLCYNSSPACKEPVWFDIDEQVNRNPFEEGAGYLLVVINDEYVEYRKALALGKTVQYFYAETSEWRTLSPQIYFNPDFSFRIKPEAGDWVTVSDYTDKVSIIKFYPERQDFVDGYYKEVRVWQPKEGEWCWSRYDGLVKILKIIDNEYVTEPMHTTCNKELRYMLSSLEPFIGELPNFLKDN